MMLLIGISGIDMKIICERKMVMNEKNHYFCKIPILSTCILSQVTYISIFQNIKIIYIYIFREDLLAVLFKRKNNATVFTMSTVKMLNIISMLINQIKVFQVNCIQML